MQPFIVFGTRGRQTKLSEGEFYCPTCHASRHYERKLARNFFSLYFIPLIPLNKGTEFIECMTCHNAYSTAVLTISARQHSAQTPQTLALADQINQLGTRLNQGLPVEYASRELTAAGLELSRAREMIEHEIGSSYKVCESCGLSYARSVSACAGCGQELR